MSGCYRGQHRAARTDRISIVSFSGADIRRRPSRNELPERSRRTARQDPSVDAEAVPVPEPSRRPQKTLTRPKTPVEVALPVLDASEVEGKTRAEILGSWKRKNGQSEP